MILLDTCTLLWLVAGADRLSAAARERLREGAGELFVSAISAFEIGVKQRKGKLALPMDAERWFTRAVEFHGLLEIPLDSRIAVRSTQLPPLHADPCDRMIVATAQLLGLTVLSPDPRIAAYPEAETVW